MTTCRMPSRLFVKPVFFTGPGLPEASLQSWKSATSTKRTMSPRLSCLSSKGTIHLEMRSYKKRRYVRGARMSRTTKRAKTALQYEVVALRAAFLKAKRAAAASSACLLCESLGAVVSKPKPSAALELLSEVLSTEPLLTGAIGVLGSDEACELLSSMRALLAESSLLGLLGDGGASVFVPLKNVISSGCGSKSAIVPPSARMQLAWRSAVCATSATSASGSMTAVASWAECFVTASVPM
mmetsp:Transcript_41723/g.75768  ORF Transcript_41723/g.75768 Transcript_41723/m.75768 type:complete len:240 (+) Transcript_41723:266-985(+)